MTALGALFAVSGIFALSAGAFAFDAEGGPTSMMVFGIALLLALAAGAGQWSFDRIASLQVALVLAFMGGVFSAAVVWFGEESHPLALAEAIVLGIVFVGGLAYFLRGQFGKSAAGNPLAEMFGSDSISELAGLQFVVKSTATPFGGVITFTIQNCFDTTRILVVALQSATPGITYPGQPVEVGPLAVVRADFPIIVPAGQVAKVDVSLGIRGGGGNRVRMWVARTYENATGTVEAVALLAVGVLRWGGGIQVQFAPGTEAGPATNLPERTDLTNDPFVLDAVKRTARARA